MKKCLSKAILVAMFMIVAAFAWSQSIFYEEPFDTNQGWTLDSNWSVTGGALQLGWSPSITDYDLSAISSDIIVPATAGDMVVSMYLNQYSGQGNPPEVFQIIAVSGTTPTVLWSYDTNADWGVSGGQDITLSLAPFADQTIQLKFRSSGATTFNFNYWYIYDIKAYASLNQDLAAMSLTGNTTPSINSEYPYVVSVRNTGLTTVSDYSVKLMQTGDIELGSVAGSSIAPQDIIEFTIPWTPTVLGATEVWAKVVMTGDENPNNDETAPITVTVMDPGLQVVEIGTGTAVNGNTDSPTPYGTWYRAFRQQFLYTADEFYAVGAAPGLISALAFNVQSLAECSPMTNYTIRMKHTDQTALNSTFEIGEYATVWQRDSFMPEAGWNTHNLDEPFLWDGASNLIVEIVTDMLTGDYARNALVYYSTTPFVSSLRYQSDSSDGSTGTTGSTLSNRSNARFFMSPLSTDPQFLVSPSSKDFGDVVLGYTPSQSFRVMNAGGGTLSINSVSISGNDYFTITDPPTLPQQIVIGEHVTFHVEYIPLTAGEHAATITITDNLRNTYAVELTGIGVDTTIYELSYSQGFDTVVAPELPMDWRSIYEATVGSGYVRTVTSSPQAGPNCISMYNPTDINTIAMLVAPPLAAAIPTNEVRVKLWGKGSSYSVKVGVMTNPADPATFAEVQTLTFTSAWEPYEVSLGTYAGDGKFIAIKHANNSTAQIIYLDTVEFELMGEDDLAAIVVAGNTSPSVGSATQYTVSVFNNGTAPQSTYTVKLYDGEDLELDTAAGTVTVTPGSIVDVVLSWTPSTEGEATVYGKVFLDGDINPGNDVSPPLTITVMEAGLLVVGIGTGTQTNTNTGAPAPYGTFYKAFRQQLLYRADDFYASGAIPGMISALAFNVQDLLTCLPMPNYTIRLKPTDQEALSTSFETGEYTTVWQRPSFMPEVGWNVHSLDEPFFWDGTSNLIVEVVTDVMAASWTYNALTYFSPTDFNSSLRYQSDSSSGSTGSTGTVSTNRSNIRFFMVPSTGDPVFIVNPSSHNFGDTNLGGSRSQNFTIINAGGGTLDISEITIADSGTMALSNLPTLPVSLETAETATFTVTYTPNSLSEDNTIISIIDNMDTRHEIGSRNGLRLASSRDTHTIPVTGRGVNDITIGDGSQTARMPMDFFYRSSLFETIYTIDELSNFVGMITGIKLYNQFQTNLTASPTKIWLGSTAQTDLATGWIPSTQLTQVFNGFVDFPSGENEIVITFPEMYMHLDGGNLVMMISRPLEGEYYSSSDLFKTQTVGSNRSRNMYSDSIDYDPANPTGGSPTGIFPKTTFLVIPGGVGDITGTVLGADASPLADVLVNVGVRDYTVLTDAQGQFTIPNVLPNDYAVTFSRHGYVTQTIDIVLAEDETEVMDVTMNLMAQVSVTGTILASDTGSGIAGANINLVGYEDYTGSSSGNGVFSIPTVFANQSYAYSVSAAGYVSTSGTIDVGAANHNMGDIILSEIAYAPNTVEAELNAGFDVANLSWNAPDPNAIEITESFEAMVFPPADWSQTITNTGEANSLGVLPTWCSFGTINVSGTGGVVPTDGSKQAGLWWDTAHQDEWLFTPTFNCPPDAYISFDTYTTMGSINDDHYYVKISTDGGTNWTSLWDASAHATEEENHYAFPITVDLAAYVGMEVKLAFHAQDPPSDDGMWYSWFIDKIYIGNFADNLSFAGSASSSAKATGSTSNTGSGNTPIRLARADGLRNSSLVENGLSTTASSPGRSKSRLLTGYKLWRLTAGQENNESSWTALTDEMITTLNYEDEGWATLPNATYKWAVKAIYTADVVSAPAFSNPLVKEVVTGNIVGFVRKAQNNQGISGATVTATGGFTTTTNSAGAYSMTVPAGIYSVSATAASYDSLTQENIAVAPNQNTTVNFSMVPTSTEDEHVPITVTALSGNYPNPFNPETTISYDIKDATNVRLNVYNIKGQLVRSLVNKDQTSGRYRVVFDGRDDKGNALSSGIYLYRFTAGKYSSTRKMMLME